eukprot:scaffold159116_cov41-Prasinocladus_malaysianus.AAC.1
MSARAVLGCLFAAFRRMYNARLLKCSEANLHQQDNISLADRVRSATASRYIVINYAGAIGYAGKHACSHACWGPIRMKASYAMMHRCAQHALIISYRTCKNYVAINPLLCLPLNRIFGC